MQDFVASRQVSPTSVLTLSTLSDASGSEEPTAANTTVQSSDSTAVDPGVSTTASAAAVPKPEEDSEALRGAYLWYRLVRYAVLDRGRTDFRLVHGCTAELLVKLVIRGWVALEDSLRWADARVMLGEGLLEQAALVRAGADTEVLVEAAGAAEAQVVRE